MANSDNKINNKGNSVIGREEFHESSFMHVQGSAPYIDDIPEPKGTLHVAFCLSDKAYGKIKSIDIDKAIKTNGVRSILIAKDIENLNIGAIRLDEPLLADKEVLFNGQAVAAVLADSHEIARKAASQIIVEIEELEAIITIEQAMSKKSFLEDPIEVSIGNAKEAIKKSTNSISGEFYIGGQEHYYLESQVALAIPIENDELVVHSSTQNPAEVQHLIGHVLGLPQHSIEIVNRRIGGAFGGKECDASQVACICALFAFRTKHPVKSRLPRSEDMLMTGKRHDFKIDYQVGFDEKGLINGIIIDFAARCGYSFDLSLAIVYRALFHGDNAYYLPNASFYGYMCKTNTASNTAFRGFGGPQGMLAIENIVEEISNYLGIDSFKVRKSNFYQNNYNNITPYGQVIEDNIINELISEIAVDTDYEKRRQDIDEFNKKSKYIKKGLALTPIKFGISFTKKFLNQAGALVHIYKDGSIYLNHGGTEMGQGLFVKVAQVVANEFGVELERVKVSATSTAKVPNTSATAASSGSDLNGMAAKDACMRIKKNLATFAKKKYNIKENDIVFAGSQVHLGGKKINFNKFISLAYLNRVELFSNGYYKTPKIHYDKANSHGRPFYYYSYGACLSEVAVDCMTGEYKLTKVDILHDVGASINPAIDHGQIVGGFIQGMGWLCSEELKWDSSGKLLTTGASTYKIPSIGDTPTHFNVTIKPNNSNHENTIHRSKAVGEPPLMLAISVWIAIKNAISYAEQGRPSELNAPASFEKVFFCLNNLNS
jgi:xanthine dehydrogenase large subunit